MASPNYAVMLYATELDDKAHKVALQFTETQENFLSFETYEDAFEYVSKIFTTNRSGIERENPQLIWLNSTSTPQRSNNISVVFPLGVTSLYPWGAGYFYKELVIFRLKG